MKAVALNSFGGPEVLKVIDVAKPEPGPGEILIKIEAAGLNRLDHYIREGGVNPSLSFPHILGSMPWGLSPKLVLMYLISRLAIG